MVELLVWLFERPGHLMFFTLIFLILCVTAFKCLSSLGPFVVTNHIHNDHALLLHQEEEEE